MKNLQLLFNHSQVPQDYLDQKAEELEVYIEYLRESVLHVQGYSFPESSIVLPRDSHIIESCKKIAVEKNVDAVKCVVVIGIGGSNLGTKAVYEAIRGQSSSHFPQVLFVDTVSPLLITQVMEILRNTIDNPSELLVNVISKSGSTTEVLANFNTVYRLLTDEFGSIDDRIVVTSDPESKLWKSAEEKGYSRLEHQQIGGRYSVMSNVGIFPLLVAGIDVKALHEGARVIIDRCVAFEPTELSDNPALMSAIVQYYHSQKNRRISNTFIFNPELESCGKWYRQLMGESIGKKHDLDGELVHAGLTPIVSIGSTDLHSVGQLYFGGPDDKITTLLYAQRDDLDMNVPTEPALDIVKGISGKSLNTIMQAIYDGVKTAYIKNNLPLMEIQMSLVNEFTIGQLLQFKEVEMMYLGKLFGVNPFDQPSVEDYKSETRKILE